MPAVGFTRNTFRNISASLGGSDAEWLYSTTDATTDVAASGYFNNAAQYVAVNEMIRAKCSDKTALFLITAVSPSVIVSEFVPS